MSDLQKQIIQDYADSYNNFDVEGMIANLHETVIFENYSNGKLTVRTEGLEEFVKLANTAKDYFTERQQTIKSWSFKDAIVSVDIDYEATLATDLPNGLKKGDLLKIGGKSEFRFSKNRIVKITDVS